MARTSKIEKLNLQQIVSDLAAQGKSARQIAEVCSKKAKQSISHVAVNDYIRTMSPVKRKEEVAADQTRLTRIVNYDIDIIELQYKTTSALVQRFDWVVELPDLFERKMKKIADELKAAGNDLDYDILSRWSSQFSDDLKKNVHNVALLNRELRENSKFMADLREKAFEFSLIQEYLMLFMDVFRKASPEAYEIAEQQIAANPRMQRIVEQQKELRGYEQ